MVSVLFPIPLKVLVSTDVAFLEKTTFYSSTLNSAGQGEEDEWLSTNSHQIMEFHLVSLLTSNQMVVLLPLLQSSHQLFKFILEDKEPMIHVLYQHLLRNQIHHLLILIALLVLI